MLISESDIYAAHFPDLSSFLNSELYWLRRSLYFDTPSDSAFLSAFLFVRASVTHPYTFSTSAYDDISPQSAWPSIAVPSYAFIFTVDDEFVSGFEYTIMLTVMLTD